MKPGYKQTEVGAIPEEWDVVPISILLASPIQNGVFNDPEKKGRGCKLINVIDLYGKFPIDTTDLERFAANRDELSRFSVNNGDLFFTRSSLTPEGIAQCNVYQGNDDEVVVFDCHIIRVRANRAKVDPVFLARFCTSRAARRQLVANAKTTTMTTVDQSVIAKLCIALPSLPEQRAIAEALSDVDALLGALDRLIAKKRDLKQAAMQQLLTGQIRLPGFRGEWEAKRLGELAKIQRGASPRPIDSPVWFDENSSIGWVRISDVTRSGMFLHETIQRLSPLGARHSRPVSKGSLIMSICATVGRPIITKIDVCIHDGFVVFDNLQPAQLFVYYFLKWIEPDWSKYGQTGSQMNLNTGLITGTRISLPSLPEQTAIAKVLGDIDEELSALEQRRAKTAALKQAMMQDLLTGRTRLV